MKRKNKKKKLRLLIIFILLFSLGYFFYTFDFDVGQAEHINTEQTTESTLNQLSYDVRDKIKKANIYLQTNYQDGYEFGSGTIIN
jgi:flagellar basal body-associated protein FliL